MPRDLSARLERLERCYGPAREAQIDHVLEMIERLQVEAPGELAAVLREFGLHPTPSNIKEK